MSPLRRVSNQQQRQVILSLDASGSDTAGATSRSHPGVGGRRFESEASPRNALREPFGGKPSVGREDLVSRLKLRKHRKVAHVRGEQVGLEQECGGGDQIVGVVYAAVGATVTPGERTGDT